MILCLSSVLCETGFSFMELIKTKLRNCMNVDTLGALMMIAANGPELSDKEAVENLVDRAFEHWRTVQKRCLARSHSGVRKPRKNKKKTVPFHDLIQEQERAARAAQAEDLSGLLDPDDKPDEPDEPGEPGGKDAKEATGDDGRMDQQTTEAIQASHGAYELPAGCKLVQKPAAEEEEWAAKKKGMKRGNSWWKGKRFAHILIPALVRRVLQSHSLVHALVREKLFLDWLYRREPTNPDQGLPPTGGWQATDPWGQWIAFRSLCTTRRGSHTREGGKRMMHDAEDEREARRGAREPVTRKDATRAQAQRQGERAQATRTKARTHKHASAQN